MRVSAQRELHIAAGQYRTAPCRGVVLKHDDKRLGADSTQCALEVGFAGEWRKPVVLLTSNHYGVVATPYDAVVVEQELPTYVGVKLACELFVVPALPHGQLRDVLRIVVIAQYGVDSVLGMQPTQRRLVAREFVGAHILNVASEGYHVGTLTVHLFYGALKQFAAHRTELDVAELHYAIAVERLRQIGHTYRHTAHTQTVGACHRTREQHVKLSQHKQQAEVVAPIARASRHTAHSTTGYRRQYEQQLGQHYQSEHEQIDVEQGEVGWRKVGNHGVDKRHRHHSSARNPPQQTHHEREVKAVAYVATINVEVGQQRCQYYE